MAAPTLRVALISGGMYDALYESLRRFERDAGVKVTVGFRGTHPELNAHLAQAGPDEYDLVSTHTKYAPSQQRMLACMNDFDTADFFPSAIELCRVGGSLRGVPRNIDLRLLHYRTDLIATPPTTWDELAGVAREIAAGCFYGFVFPGMESGLFGTFFELAESAGAGLFLSGGKQWNRDAGRWALGMLHDLYASGAVPAAIVDWHYDEVHQFFQQGGAALVADWPGFYESYRAPDSAVRGRFAVARMPAGPAGRVCCVAGCHTFALTHSGVMKSEAWDLLRFLTAPEQQVMEAGHGSVPVRRSVMEIQRRRASADDAGRLTLLSQSIDSDLLIPPKTAAYAGLENALWPVVQAAMLGEISVDNALTRMERRISECMPDAA